MPSVIPAKAGIQYREYVTQRLQEQGACASARKGRRGDCTGMKVGGGLQRDSPQSLELWFQCTLQAHHGINHLVLNLWPAIPVL